MKVLTETLPFKVDDHVANRFTLPQGLIGFAEYTRAELLYIPEHLPFLWMKLENGIGEPVHFVVVEPGSVLPDYTPEIFDADAAALDLREPSEAMVLNIVTLEQQRPLEAKVNLIGPIVVNRRTHSGRQLVLSNYMHYSAHHLLLDAASPTPVAVSA